MRKASCRNNYNPRRRIHLQTMAVCKPREEASLRCGFPWIRAHTEAQPRSGLHCSDDAFVADMEPPSGFERPRRHPPTSTGRFVAFAPHVTRGFCK
jgi:hypothetical protein